MNDTLQKVVLGVCTAVVFAGFGFTANIVQAADQCEHIIVNKDRNIRGEIGESFSYEIDIDGGQPDTIEVRGTLPRGLSFDEDMREIHGTPREGGRYVVAVFAENECGIDTASLRMYIEGDETDTGGAGSNVSVTSELTRGDGTYVNLSNVPYTGFGDSLRTSLTVLALVLWSGALAFIFLGPVERARLRSLALSFFGGHQDAEDAPQQASLIDRNIDQTVDDPNQAPNSSEENEMDVALLQKLREHAYEERVLMTEKALSALTDQAQKQGYSAENLLASIVENAKATYPREDGFLKIDSSRLNELLQTLHSSGLATA